ncbi:S8 family serine peptidase [Lentzea tibetensis]|uniref:S8 family serine peptidase n=1 Tax=Lentzea tibetensis TaxID=2591470 RepID=UPI001F37C3F5|nr:S8 family serine peptidase [Lentzea tibetensis]
MLGLILAAAVVNPAVAQQQSTMGGQAPAQAKSDQTRSVTLITGDRVVVQDGKPTAIVRAKGRENVKFVHQRYGGHTYVLPEDALEPVASGKVDRRLFDVTGLIQFGYDDAKRKTLPVLVTRDAAAGVQVTRALAGTELSAAQAPRTADSWQALAAGAGKVWLDGMRTTSLDKSTKQIGAPAAWQAGYTGKGVKVAVLDTGVDADHPDLKGKQLTEKNFTEDPDNTDTVGHGTHVAATIASGDATFRGVAPDAQILDGKVCTEGGCAESWILDGMRWAAEQGADVVNMSLGGMDTPDVDPLEDAVNKLSAQYGTLFVIAAGNSYTFEPVSSPSTADAALSVGAVDRDDSLAPFSSRGPRKGDGAVKPEVTAPGVGIVAAKAGTTERLAASGTSMATPHTAGAAALLAQQHPDWTGAQIKAQLIASAKPNPANTAFEQGAGRIDVAKAITQTITADPVTVALGNQPWPHNDDKPVTKEVTYRNSGTSDVALDLRIDSNAPAGMLAVSPAKLTVPAGGSAKASVTGDSRVGTTDGAFSGAVVASSGAVSARTPVGIQREVESYNVTVNTTGRDGKPTENHRTLLINVDGPGFVDVPREADGNAVVRVPKGHYYAESLLLGAPGAKAIDVETYSDVDVTRDLVVDFDARKAKPISITGPDPAVTQTDAVIVHNRTGKGGGLFSGVSLGTFEDVGVAGFGPKLTAKEFTAGFSAGFTSADATRHVYAFEENGLTPTGYAKKVSRPELAEVRTKIGPLIAGRHGVFGVGPVFPSGNGFTALYESPAPGSVKYLVNTEKGFQWGRSYWQLKGQEFPPEVVLGAPAETYRASRSYDERINFAVFGPALNSEFANIGRQGDNIGVGVPMHAEQADGRGNSYVFDTASTKLYRDGKLIGQSPYPSNGLFENVPGGAATFKVDGEITRSTTETSTKVTTSWTFRSDTVPGNEFKSVPLSVVRFEPELSDSNSAQAGKLLRVPLRVQQSKGADNGRINRVTVEVSFDDGKTWQRVPVVGGKALVHNPGKAGFASLRAKASDTLGNCSEVTVIRAYKIA